MVDAGGANKVGITGAPTLIGAGVEGAAAGARLIGGGVTRVYWHVDEHGGTKHCNGTHVCPRRQLADDVHPPACDGGAGDGGPTVEPTVEHPA
jgi:hypothetical protein